MIDFRYHIVSIVSIFLALAVGILLGAGPLQGNLGTTLTNQVSTLRQEKSDLRTQLDAAQRQVDAGDAFATAITPDLVSARLGGYPIVVVTLPGADADTVTALTGVLAQAGGTVSGTVGITSAWTDPAKAGVRDELLTTLAPSAGESAGEVATPERRLGALLASALLVPKLTDVTRPDTTAAATLAALKAADLVTYDGDGPVAATLAVVVAPAPDAKVTDDRRTSDLAGWVALARGLDAAGRGSAVVGVPDSAGTGGVVAAVRAEAATAKVVSTVDDLGTPMGLIATVYALREQAAGAAGQYGVGAGASAVLPASTATRP
ncbi:MAG: copper transporter [Actinomycetota bacterium]